jgi:hypothetical protein
VPQVDDYNTKQLPWSLIESKDNSTSDDEPEIV